MTNKIIFVLISILFSSIVAFAQVEITEEQIISQKTLETKFQGLDGNSFSLSDSKAKFKIILLWASWSPYGVMALENLGREYAYFVKKDVEIFGFVNDVKKLKKSEIRKALKLTREYNIKFKNAFAEDIFFDEFTSTRKATPQILILEDNGKVSRVFLGFAPDKTIEKLKNFFEKVN
jgi:hypothetical protein